MEDRLKPLHWDAPWLAPWRERGAGAAADEQAGLSRHEALNAQACPGFRFVAASALPEGQPYEQYIFETRRIPTRDNLHDFFNGLCWLTFPQTKSRLNELQAAEIARDGIGGRRGPVRDAITLLDENGAILFAPAPLREALCAQHWREAFVALRPLWKDARIVLFGHALLEKLAAAPRKDITAHVWHVAQPWENLDELDVRLAAGMTPERLAEKPFTPLPISGIPGWNAGNEDFSFYDDSLVFRPRRASRTP
ncbi:MAG: DUF3025 domain-containing protein [Burkholderiaceae bacterium]